MEDNKVVDNTTEEVVEKNSEEINPSDKGFKSFLKSLFNGENLEDKKEPEQEVEEPEKDKKDEPSFEDRLEAEKKKWEEEQKKEKEFEKLPTDEKAKLKEKEREEKIKSLEQELLKKDLKDNAVNLLNKEGYPVKLAEILNYGSKEEMEQSMKVVTEVFKASITEAVNDRLKSKTPDGLGSAGVSENFLNDEIAKAVRGGF